jgi:2-keto-4-pentenoate hydratase
MSAASAQQAARLLAALRGPRAAGTMRPAALPPELAPRSEAQAYAVQGALAQLLGASVGGWKASLSAVGDGHAGHGHAGHCQTCHGQAAPLYRRDIHATPARVPCPDVDGVGVEPEIAFLLGRDLEGRPDGRPYGLEDLDAAIDAVHPVIEIVHSRFAELDAAPPLDRLADNLSNAGLVRGPGCRSWRTIPLGAVPLRLEVRRPDGTRSAHEGRGGHGHGDPRLPLLWLVNDAIARGVPLRRGELVTTGSCAGLHPVGPGARVSVHFDGLGTVELALD